jgi:hypothetical protein
MLFNSFLFIIFKTQNGYSHVYTRSTDTHHHTRARACVYVYVHEIIYVAEIVPFFYLSLIVNIRCLVILLQVNIC